MVRFLTLSLLLLATALFTTTNQASAGWKIDSQGKLVYETTGQVLSKGSDDDNSGSGSGDSNSGSGSSGSSNSSESSSTETKTVNPTTGVKVETKESPQETKTEIKFNETEKIKTRTKENESRIDVVSNGTKVRLEQKDGRLVIKTENEAGEETEVEDNDVLKIEDRLDKEQIRVATGSGQGLIFAKGNTAAETSLPLEVNLETNELTVTTPAGTKTVTVLPSAAVANLLAANVIDRLGRQAIADAAKLGQLTGVSGIISLGEKNGVPVYEIAGLSDQKLLAFIPVSIKKTVTVSAETGEILQTQESLTARLLDLLAF